MTLKKIAVATALSGLLAAAVLLYLARPHPLSASIVPEHRRDIQNGKVMYHAGGCISCHKPGDKNADPLLPSGGFALKTPVGTFYPPNLTPDELTGIGKWSDIQFVNALMRGISPDNRHYFPAFPYTSYVRMKLTDVLDLKAYLMTLKPVHSPARQPDMALEPLVRMGMGIWKWIGFDRHPLKADPSRSDSWNRGAYLVAGPGHCNECHTPRNLFMAVDFSRHLQGGPHPEGKGKVPSLRGLKKRKRFSDVDDLNSALRFGEMLGYEDMSSGGMGDVQTNLSNLPEADTRAIAEYLLSLE